MPNIQIVRENSLGLNRGIYATWTQNALSDANANTLLAEGSAVTVTEVPYQTPKLNENGDLVDQEGNVIYPSDLPENVYPKSWRHVGGNGGFPKSKQGGASQGLSRAVVPIYQDVAVGQKIVFGFATTADYQESSNLNNAIWQVGVEPYPMAGTITPAYFIPHSQNITSGTAEDGIPETTAITATFDNSKRDAQFVWTAPAFIKSGSFLSVWIWAKNGFGVTAANDMADKSRIPASQYFGDFFFLDQNSTNYNNNTLALFTDGSITGMSDATRGAQTNSLIDSSGVVTALARSGGYYHISPWYVLFYSDKFNVGGVGDSRNQKGGSSNCLVWDQSYTFGNTGKLLGRKYAVLDLSAANDQFSYWVNTPAWNAVRRRALQYVVGWHNADGVNDIGQYIGDIPTLTSNYNAFMSLPEFQGKVAIGSTIPPFASFTPGASNPPSNFGITETTAISSSQASRLALNALILSDERYAKVYDLNTLFTSRNNQFKPKIPKFARSVVGSAAPAGAFTITNAVWASTNGGQVTFTVSADPRVEIQPNDWVVVTGITESSGSLDGTYKVISTTSTTVVVLATASSSIGTYSSGGTLTSRNFVVTLTSGNFIPSDECLSITSVDFRGSGVWGFSIIDRVTSATTAICRYPNNTAMTSVGAGQTFFIGGSYLVNFEGSAQNQFDTIHTSRFFYQYLYEIGETGLFSEGSVGRLPELV